MAKTLVSLVTGAASGLGKATVDRLVSEGYKVIMCDLATSSGKSVADSIGPNVKFVPTDVRSEADVQNAVDVCHELHGKLNLIVNCAGISVARKTYNFNKGSAHELQEFSNLMMVNVVGTFNVLRLAVGLMGKNEIDENGERGVIVNTSGFAAFDGQMGQVALSACHGAINSMTLPLARDMASQKIRHCTIAPGLFDTPLTQFLPDKVKSYFADMTPLPKRMGQPEEFANLVVSVVNNPFLNGEVIRLDGALRFI
ncbi:3-hydroxyacyl-CoA dehydrogenase type-2-like [Adelges cooleyi]|uniref:3-hydroxyacyl-CoA dehydrogenase type-2-like n=1 Tax=Adelges cooleyi TaxID=133065 RepID=UPI00217FC72D|nr:3-hydroxyacyl-CoA dehydrogenase type-2-like [Adelges cooleyi]XP_050422811.1 3-hydroxyacyl-CoA dehydrogenase type-2-like [Adelges cooleyi]